MSMNRGLVVVTREGMRSLLGYPDGALVTGFAFDPHRDSLLVTVDHETMPQHREGEPLMVVEPPAVRDDDTVEIVTLTEGGK